MFSLQVMWRDNSNNKKAGLLHTGISGEISVNS